MRDELEWLTNAGLALDTDRPSLGISMGVVDMNELLAASLAK